MGRHTVGDHDRVCEMEQARLPNRRVPDKDRRRRNSNDNIHCEILILAFCFDPKGHAPTHQHRIQSHQSKPYQYYPPRQGRRLTRRPSAFADSPPRKKPQLMAWRGTSYPHLPAVFMTLPRVCTAADNHARHTFSWYDSDTWRSEHVFAQDRRQCNDPYSGLCSRTHDVAYS